MNTQSKSNNETRNNVNSLINLFVAILATLTFATAAAAADSDLERHNPYTVLGHQLRSQLTVQWLKAQAMSDSQMNSVPPTLFQEIVPCRLVSTLEDDKYATPWGPGPYALNETRTYNSTGMLVDGDFINPCSEQIPVDAIALALRLSSRNSLDNGTLWLSPGLSTGVRMPALPFHAASEAQDEADVLLHDGRFAITADAPTHLMIDVIGYFIPDPNGNGTKGDRGEQGLKGEKGETGAQGLKGDQGEAGAQGLKGDQGEAGAQGLKGDQGEAGAQGLKGDKGDTGAQGLKGDQGEAGAQGLKGDKGDAGAQGLKGDKGETGAQGLKGDKGETGAQGAKGDRGETGAQGPKGAQGPAGPMGPMGPKGDQGEQGPPGTAGIAMITGTRTFPPPGQITIYEPSVTVNSVIILIYTEVSNGNALGIASQRSGSFVATGSPNKPFKYIILNAR